MSATLKVMVVVHVSPIFCPSVQSKIGSGLTVTPVGSVYPGTSPSTKEIVLDQKYDRLTFLDRSKDDIHGLTISILDAISRVKTKYVIVMDADGQHRPEDLNRLLEHIPAYDMVVGARQRRGQASWGRAMANQVYNRLASYVTKFHVEDLRRSAYMDFPKSVHLETFAKCNAACVFCPYPQLERKDVKMSDQMIDKIITDLQDIPDEHEFDISPHKVNEPLLDKRLFDIMEDCHIPCRIKMAFDGMTIPI